MTLLFDDSKRLEKALGEEAAGVLINILEKQDGEAKRELATKQDLREMELRLKQDLTVRMGALLAATVGIIAALKLFS